MIRSLSQLLASDILYFTIHNILENMAALSVWNFSIQHTLHKQYTGNLAVEWRAKEINWAWPLAHRGRLVSARLLHCRLMAESSWRRQIISKDKEMSVSLTTKQKENTQDGNFYSSNNRSSNSENFRNKSQFCKGNAQTMALTFRSKTVWCGEKRWSHHGLSVVTLQPSPPERGTTSLRAVSDGKSKAKSTQEHFHARPLPILSKLSTEDDTIMTTS